MSATKNKNSHHKLLSNIINLGCFSIDVAKRLVNYVDLEDVVNLVATSPRLKHSFQPNKLGSRYESFIIFLVDYICEVKGVHFTNSKGHTMLHLAALTGQLGLVKYLIEHKNVDHNCRDKEDHSAWSLAHAETQQTIWSRYDVEGSNEHSMVTRYSAKMNTNEFSLSAQSVRNRCFITRCI